MALKDEWKDLEDKVQGDPDSGSEISVEPINKIAHAVIDIEENNKTQQDIIIDTEMSDTSENTVQNKIIKKYVDDKTDLIEIALDSTNKSLQYYGDVNIKPSDESLFSFVIDDETMTAKIKAESQDISGDIVIPYEYEKDGAVYKVTEVGSFDNRYLITGIIIPNSITSIEAGAFQYCAFLSVAIPNSMKAIDSGAFSLSSIQNITIPNSVTVIGQGAFSECLALTDVYYEGTKEQWNKIKIDNYNEDLLNATIHYDYIEVSNIETALENKADKPSLIIVNEPNYNFEFSNLDNCVVRMGSAESISFTFGDGEYPNIYMSSLSFDSGETPTAIDYTGSGILNWVGVDCVNNNGLSIFQPSANKHYDIVFDFNGTQFIGLVNGFVPATGNVVSE